MVVLLLAAPAPSIARTGSSVRGAVTDASGAPLRDARITITHLLNGRRLELTTGENGDYHAVALIPGDYDVSAARTGFVTVTRLVTLIVDADVTVDFSLPISPLTGRTTVVAELPLVEVGHSQPSSVVLRQQLDSLPVLDRNVLSLAQLVPGSGPVNSTVARFAVARFGGPADQRSGYTTLVDGGDIDDAQWGSPTINLGQEAVQEFRVLRYQFGAEYGHALNAVVTVVTRSGTNRLSGSGWHFGRDDALNARNPFTTNNPPFGERRVGAAFGGPVIRDRSHFFATYERDHLDTVRIIALPPSNPFAVHENGVFPAATLNHMASASFDYRPGPVHAWLARYGYDNQRSLRSAAALTSDSSQVDVANHSHRLIVEHTWTPRQNVAHGLRLYWLGHSLGTLPRNFDVGIIRPSGTTGQTNNDSQVVSRSKVLGSDTLYLHARHHEIKAGGEFAYAVQDNDSHALENGVFTFQTDTPFDALNAATWPRVFTQQAASVVTYRSREVTLFLQDDWRLGRRLHLNTGLRYDLDFDLRVNHVYRDLLRTSQMAGLSRFVTSDRGTDTNNLQPRLGATWDTRGDGRLVIKGGWGVYVARNRPWFPLRSMSQFASNPIRITGAECLKAFPDISRVLGARQPDGSFACQGPRQIGTLIPDDFVQPYALNTTLGLGWQLSRGAALQIDYVHSAGRHQTGFTDRNLPASGPLTATNPRPVVQFGQVLTIENYSKSWYDAIETQWRGQSQTATLNVSYALSRSYLDGVDFFLSTRGTQRTPHERGYNPSDQRHNLTLAGSLQLPWDVQLAGILKLISGSPMKVQAGFDLDGDTVVVGDLPPDIPITVGRERVDESLAAINALRDTLGMSPVERSLLKLDAFRSLDVRVRKDFHAGRIRLQLLAEAYNVTNFVNLRPPVGSPPNAGSNINSSAFLRRSVARDARQIQWGVRVTF